MNKKPRKRKRTAHLRVNPLNDRGLNVACHNLDTIANEYNQTKNPALYAKWQKEAQRIAEEIRYLQGKKDFE